VKDVVILVIWLGTLFFLIRGEIRKKDRYVTNENFDSLVSNFDSLVRRVNLIESSRGIAPTTFSELCSKRREECMVHDTEVLRDIKEIKARMEKGERKFTTLGVIQVAMCKFINMPKEDIEMFKDAVYNGRELKRDV